MLAQQPHCRSSRNTDLAIDYCLNPNSPHGFALLAESGSEPLHMVAFDCEMCETAEGQELTRMTLLNEDGKV